MPRRATKRDLNHVEIAGCFRRLGWLFLDTDSHAQYTPGFPDGIALYAGVVLFVEIKSETGALTEDEADFMMMVIEAEADYRVVRTEQDVIDITNEFMPGRVTG